MTYKEKILFINSVKETEELINEVIFSISIIKNFYRSIDKDYYIDFEQKYIEFSALNDFYKKIFNTINKELETIIR